LIKARNFERVLHQWEPWLRAVKDARLESHLDSDAWWAYAETIMRRLSFPSKPLLCLYFLSCVFSQYEINGTYCFDRIQLPSLLFDKFDLFNTKIAPAISRFVYAHDFLRIRPIRLCPDLMGMRERPLPPALWNKDDVEFALQWESHLVDNPYEGLRKYYSPFFLVLPLDHAIVEIATKGKRRIDDALAIQCAEMKDIEGKTYAQIAERFGWARQEDSYGKPTRSSTARRYVRRGRKLRGGR
jgi:hypothetical protein